MSDPSRHSRETESELLRIMAKPPEWLGVLACVCVLAIVAYAQFFLALTGTYSLGFGLPLLVCLWTRNRRLLLGLALLVTGLMFIKTVLILGHQPGAAALPAQDRGVAAWLIQGVNLWVTTLAVYLAITAMERADAKGRQLKGQSEELSRRAGELQAANEELVRREHGLQTLLESARWLRSDLSEADVMSAVCQVAVQIAAEAVSAAAVVHERAGKLALRGHYGFGVHGTLLEEVPFAQTFATEVMKRGQTGFISDLATRPEIRVPQPAAGKPFRSVLSAPLKIEGRAAGAVEVYAREPRTWSESEFRVIEWLAAQCSLALEAIEYQQEAAVKRREAEETAIQKTRFLAAVSHDVRTPANAISLLADLIEKAASSPDAHESAEIPVLARDLKSSARSLVELVSDVLDLSRLDAGRHDLEMNEFALGALLATLVRQVQPIALEKMLRLTCQPQPELYLRTDKMKLARVISNLLGNAVKFTEAGEVEVSCGQAPEGGLTISVRDTGVGIPQEALPRIFDEFYQIRNTERDRNKGTGLGLAICKRLAGALGCSLNVQSRVGVGTTFTLHLPASMILPRGNLPAASATARAAGEDDFLRGRKVLLVEDHEVTRRAAGRLLASRGAIILEASTGREALHLLVHEQPEILLLDLMLPDADGADILRHLQVRRPASLQCVLAVSGDVREARVQEIKELGADDLLPKPLNIERLLEGIAAGLHGSGQMAAG